MYGTLLLVKVDRKRAQGSYDLEMGAGLTPMVGQMTSLKPQQWGLIASWLWQGT